MKYKLWFKFANPIVIFSSKRMSNHFHNMASCSQHKKQLLRRVYDNGRIQNILGARFCRELVNSPVRIYVKNAGILILMPTSVIANPHFAQCGANNDS